MIVARVEERDAPGDATSTSAQLPYQNCVVVAEEAEYVAKAELLVETTFDDNVSFN